ncbi:MAG TPA: hypothetical protein VMV10_05240 [Pirellulales bacterium]|nr:hypothetical protein [Pirellulales bacterium]
MKGERKTTRNIKTLGVLLDRRRARTAGGALLELASLAHERTRLKHELRRLLERHGEIDARLAEIGEKENWLRSIAEQAPPGPSLPRPAAEPPGGVFVRELNY